MIEKQAVWKKATASNGSNNCVEVARTTEQVLVRNSRDPHGRELSFTHGEWEAFLDGAVRGEFGLSESAPA